MEVHLEASSGSLARLGRRIVLLEPGEAGPLLWSAGYFLLVMFSYYLLRPMREAAGIARGADSLPWLMTGTLAVMFLVSPAFAALVSRLPRRRFIPLVYRGFAVSLLGFYGGFRCLGHPAALGYAFYIWLSVFNLFVVSVFWAFMADTFRSDQGRRLFGILAMGGTLGSLLGAGVTEALLRGVPLPWGVCKVQPATLILLSVASLELAVRCVNHLARHWGLGLQAGGAREPGPGIFEGLRLIARSPYLALICGYLLLFTLTSTLLYLKQGQIVARTFPPGPARTAAFARIDFAVNALTLATQFLLTSRILKGAGIRGVLCLLPLLTLAGFGALWAWPAFGTLVVFQVLRRGLHYAVDRPARETLYIPLGPDEKYKSKPFIDTFVYRGGDLLGAWTPGLLALLAVPLGPAALGISALWLWAAVGLGRAQGRVAGPA